MRYTSPLFLSLAVASLSGCYQNHNGSSPSNVDVLGFVGFETRIQVPIGARMANDASVTDIDGDGILDFMVTDGDGTLRTLLGQGGGAFQPGREYPIGGVPFGILNGDWNNDGASDAVVLRDPAGRADVFINTGNGGDLGTPTTLDVGEDISAFAGGDIDNDGILDLVIAREGGDGVEYFAGRGDGTFAAPQLLEFPRAKRAFGLAIGDIDGDGRDDIALGDTDAEFVNILLSDGASPPANLTAVPVGVGPAAVAIGDVTADGSPDLVVSTIDSKTIEVIALDGQNRYAVVQTLPVDGTPANLVIGDVSGDGVSDVVVSVFDRYAISVLRGDVGGLVPTSTQSSTSGEPYRPTLGDFNGDGRTDLAVFSLNESTANLYLGRGDGLSGDRLHRIERVPQAAIVANLDADSDGRDELAVGGFESTFVSIQRVVDTPVGNDPKFAEVAAIDLGASVQNIVPGDIDQDGRTDLLVAVSGGVWLLANETPAGGSVAFRPMPMNRIAPAAGPFEMIGDDIDGDGVTDLVVTYHIANRVSLLLGQGNGSFAFGDPISADIPGRPLGLACADFDGDLQKEIAISRLDAAAVTILDRNASGDLVPQLDIPVGAIPNYLRTADFNNDGRSDLVVSNAAANQVTMLLAEQGGGFRPIEIDAGSAPTALLARDLNRDGAPDILVTSLDGSDFRVILGDGNGGVASTQVFPGTFTAFSAALADLNGNGLQDLAIGSLVTRRLAVFKNSSRQNL